MLSIELVLLQVADPALLEQIEKASAEPASASALLHVLALEDEDDDRFQRLFVTAPVVVFEGSPAHLSAMLKAPALTRVWLDDLGRTHTTYSMLPVGGWAVDVTSETSGSLELHVVVDQPVPVERGTVVAEGGTVTRVLDWTGAMKVEAQEDGHVLLDPGEGLLLFASAVSVTSLADNVTVRAASAARTDEVLRDYDLRRRRERGRALDDLLAVVPSR